MVRATNGGKAMPRGERNNLSQEQIVVDPGSGSWRSIALKQVLPELVCG